MGYLVFGRLAAVFVPVPCIESSESATSEARSNVLYEMLKDSAATCSVVGFVPVSSVTAADCGPRCLLQPKSTTAVSTDAASSEVVPSALLAQLLLAMADANTVGVCRVVSRFALLLPLPLTPGGGCVVHPFIMSYSFCFMRLLR